MCSSRKVAILSALMTLGKFVGFGGSAFGVQLLETLVFLIVPHRVFVETQVV
jgi:hypothetical protein